jgi:hypothetical protein
MLKQHTPMHTHGSDAEEGESPFERHCLVCFGDTVDNSPCCFVTSVVEVEALQHEHTSLFTNWQNAWPSLCAVFNL